MELYQLYQYFKIYKAMWQGFYLYLSSKRSDGWLYLESIVSNEIIGQEFDLFVFKISYMVKDFILNLDTYDCENSTQLQISSALKLDERESNILKYVAGFVAFS